ncbi:riboflavin biosynthesis protein RibF [Marinilactibacillus psychrotolerans]|uniref:Riboflavin biosynthesis protein n=1 Tax=Marinilactibacillus psychrotolerans 42ea TaxID=1255609 RepID=A0A1R4K408_9LACT|nr:riboflavin biosynthesis protein RibF [Marinilactibacillus psychrotolerans]GEQ32722.1 riboflavin biosynthesis protein RibF [Marinilactibacillus psychrotolerans]SJN38815.1 Riboflavin kinase / FMN adenylyltransferase [Marinilactibacillus psychrotolerans 42ea]
MEIIKIHHPYDPTEIIQEDIVLILGFFDGIHKGHQKVIETGVRIAKERGIKSALMTFNRHPAFVYKKFDPEYHSYLTTMERKELLIAELGVDILYEVEFTSSFGSLPPQEFVDQYIVGWHAKAVVAGFDYTYGKADIANMDNLNEYAKNRFDIFKVEKQDDSNQKISSSRIRQAILDGKLAKANELLGYLYETSGFVIHGDARGRTLGYPTANILSDPDVFMPKIGVYAVKMLVNNTWYDGMASIGYNPTFGYRKNLSVEVHLFDFKKEIYGENVRIKWIKYLRDEIRYDSIEALIKQLRQDEIESREVIAKVKTNQIL